MTITRDLPTAWTVARDEAFFRIVQSLFKPSWVFAASTMLASYDDEAEAQPSQPAGTAEHEAGCRGRFASGSAHPALSLPADCRHGSRTVGADGTYLECACPARLPGHFAPRQV